MFTGKLVTLLTVPQYEKQIQSLEELAESNNSIITINYKLCSNDSYKNHKEIYRKIKKRFICYSGYDYQRLINSEEASINFTILIIQEILQQITKRFYKRYYYFKDNYFLGTKIVFTTLPYSYFTVTLNEIISRLIESGLLDHRRAHYDYINLNRTITVIKNKKLNLDHLYPIFVFWIIGLLIASVAFAGELLLSTLKRKCHRR